MDNSTRLQYLESMGIDVWVSRKSTVVEEVQFVDETSVQVIEQEEKQAVVDDWAKLQKEVAECQRCTLCNTRTQTVFGAGNKNADWMFIGEAPGQSEDLEGKPFVGQAGLLLTEMIRAIGLERDSVYIASILKCRPPNNRDPKVEEVKACHDYLQQQIALIKPKIILAVGRIAAQTLLETSEPLSKLRGRPHQLMGIPLVVVYHPAYLLRSLLEKRKAWQDLQMAIKVYQEK
jgi:DNA polymerase